MNVARPRAIGPAVADGDAARARTTVERLIDEKGADVENASSEASRPRKIKR